MKEWKKPFVKCVLLDESDLITTSDPDCPSGDDNSRVGFSGTQESNDDNPIFENPWH